MYETSIWISLYYPKIKIIMNISYRNHYKNLFKLIDASMNKDNGDICGEKSGLWSNRSLMVYRKIFS